MNVADADKISVCAAKVEAVLSEVDARRTKKGGGDFSLGLRLALART